MGKKPQKRINVIEEYLCKNKQVSVSMLAQEFDVSLETIRRDLSDLEKRGIAERIYGGAILCNINDDVGKSFQVRKSVAFDEKRIMARNLIQYFEEGLIIGLDASSSSWHVADELPNIPCTVVTNSMQNVAALRDKNNIKIIASGGVYSSKYDAFYGPLSEQMFNHLHLDLAIVSCTGFDCNGGVWESNELNASNKKAMMLRATKKFLLADCSKYNKKNLISLMNLQDVNKLFLTQQPSYELQQYCLDHNIFIEY